MRLVERQWEWRFAAAPAQLWPLLADTARFNEAAGLARYAVEDTPLPDGTVAHTGSLRRFGLSLSWDEGVPQWVAGRLFAHHRIFHSGPLRRMETRIEIDPEPGGGSRVRYRIRFEPRYWPIGPLLRRVGLDRFGRTLDQLFGEAAAFAAGQRERVYDVKPPAISPGLRQRVTERARLLAQAGYGAVERLATHLLDAPESDLERMRPLALARGWGSEPRTVIEAFLAAARAGLLTLRWDLVCPRCRGAKLVAGSLDQLPQGAHCSSCNIDYERDFSRNVEVTFEPAADIRPIGDGTYCLASPLASEHVKVQYTIPAGSEIALPAELPDGFYRSRTVEPGGSADFLVEGGRLPQIVLTGGDPEVLPSDAAGELRVRNPLDAARTIVIEDRGWSAEALTAHEVTTMQAFRDLFADAVLRPGDQVEIRRVAFLFTDIKGSSDLYNRVGDARAYGFVREHYAVLTRAVREHHGAVVKTIGDAVMAAFSSPEGALAAAVRIRDDIVGFNRSLAGQLEHGDVALIVKLGLHCGPCIAVTLNDRLDYFGRTVNLAARLEGESRGGDIVLSQEMAAEPGMEEALAALGAVTESAHVKGFFEPIRLRRIPPQG